MKLITLRFNDGQKHTEAEHQYLRSCEDIVNKPPVLNDILRKRDELMLFGSAMVFVPDTPTETSSAPSEA